MLETAIEDVVAVTTPVNPGMVVKTPLIVATLAGKLVCEVVM
jgi:hypothetical protein